MQRDFWRFAAWAGVDTAYIGLCPSVGYRNGAVVIGLTVGPFYVGLRFTVEWAA